MGATTGTAKKSGGRGGNRTGSAARDHATSQHERIRLAAVRLFTAQGYAATSIKQLANELKMVPANLYNYYPNKESLLFEVLSHQLTELLERDAAIVKKYPDPVARLRALIVDLVMEDLRNPQAAFVGRHGLNGLSGTRRERISQMMADVRRVWLSAVRDGVKSGDFDTADPKLSTLTILSLCASTSTWFHPGGEHSAEEIAEHTALLALRGLGHHGPLPDAA